jgi:hypothetical protein
MAAAEPFDIPRGVLQKTSGFRQDFLGQHHQKLAPAARSKQQPRQPQLGQQRPGKDLSEQADPASAAQDQPFAAATIGFAAGPERGEQVIFDSDKLALKEELNRHAASF